MSIVGKLKQNSCLRFLMQSKQSKRKARSQEGEKLVLRRSSRVANLPWTSYKEVGDSYLSLFSVDHV